MTDFLTALALVFVIEGLTYAAFPRTVRRALLRLETVPESGLRKGGLIAAVAGVAMVWALRGGM